MAENLPLYLSPVVLEARRRSNQRKEVKRNSSYASKRIRTGDQNPKNDGGFTRRKFLLGLCALGGIATAIAIGVTLGKDDESQNSPFDNWERYKGKEFPTDLTVDIGKSLVRDMEYPGFSDVGNLIVQSQLNPQKLRSYFPILSSRIPLQSADIHEPGVMEPRFTNTFIGQQVVTDKLTGNTFQDTFAESDSLELTVKIDGGIYLAPQRVRELVVAKEFSHILYLQKCADNITSQVEARYSISRASDTTSLSTFLFVNSVAYGGQPNRNSLGDAFDNAKFDIDGAGYWHIMRAFGKMKVTNQLSIVDLDYLSSANTAFEQARASEILIQENSNFRWKEDITPFSPEWTNITRPLLK
ncbi:hypothetical protein HYT02_04330 [Candidatus Gottesmanbacteria bacterium]|nr:hypothetical protein [Candidatus Gottesmanbacteria bacterium]